MGWSLGYDKKWQRDIGYGVPAYCDFPGCNAEIDRGLSCVCGGEPRGGERGCGLYFCSEHLNLTCKLGQLCDRCWPKIKKPFPLKEDHPDWITHKLVDKSWAEWRNENPEEVIALNKIIADSCKIVCNKV
jgi:hypothetical protein